MALGRTGLDRSTMGSHPPITEVQLNDSYRPVVFPENLRIQNAARCILMHIDVRRNANFRASENDRLIHTLEQKPRLVNCLPVLQLLVSRRTTNIRVKQNSLLNSE